MTPEEIQEHQRQNFESRVETMQYMHNKFVEKLRELDPYDAVMYSTPMCDCFMQAINNLEYRIENKKSSDLINKALSDDTTTN